ncbi:hypothetical protein OIU84_010474 [Salix udensis]|uniref:Uncharacterized protein n=1 Tax=Salix udensis TaxID=889485 RepID=A0AAD6JKT8_9ROSI|nr:hypothetical protein OIU84_010474 [Salix udensis]
MMGRPLSCDESTFCCTRLDYARVCVEIDATKPFIKNFDLKNPLSANPLHIEVEENVLPEEGQTTQRDLALVVRAQEKMTTQLPGHTQPLDPSSHHTLKVIMKDKIAIKPTDQEVPAAEEELARIAKGKMKEVEDNMLTVNNPSSHQSQASLDEEESSANTAEAGGQTDVNVTKSPQWVTCSVHSVLQDFDITVSFFYEYNTPAARQEMWDPLTVQEEILVRAVKNRSSVYACTKRRFTWSPTEASNTTGIMGKKLRQDHLKPRPSFKFLNFWAERGFYSPYSKSLAGAHSGIPHAKFDWDEAHMRLDEDPRAEEAISSERNKAKIKIELG